MPLREVDILAPNDKETEKDRRRRIMYEKWYDELGRKMCQRCREYKDPKEFSKKKALFDGLQNNCKECARQIMLESRAKKKDDFELADNFRQACNTQISIVHEIINRSMNGWYD